MKASPNSAKVQSCISIWDEKLDRYRKRTTERMEKLEQKCTIGKKKKIPIESSQRSWPGPRKQEAHGEARKLKPILLVLPCFSCLRNISLIFTSVLDTFNVFDTCVQVSESIG